MDYFKFFFISLFFVIVCSCSQEDDTVVTDNDFGIAITSLDGSDDEVVINWEIERPSNSIIEDIRVYRNDTYTSLTLVVDQLISSVPSNSSTFIDTEIPYTTSVSYVVEVRFSYQGEDGFESLTINSDREIFTRDFTTFSRVPFQVEKDPIQLDVFHIFDRNVNSRLVRYDASESIVSNTSFLGPLQDHFNEFQFRSDNRLAVTETNGIVKTFDTNNYELINEFEVPNNEIIKAFVFIESKFYYRGENGFYYSYDEDTGENFNVFFGVGDILRNFNNSESLLYIISNFTTAEAGIIRLPNNCPVQNECDFEVVKQTDNVNLQGFGMNGSNIDPNLFVLDEEKELFISGRSGSVFDLNSFTQLSNFELQTNNKYFNFAFGSDNKIYGAVQAKKEIHVFDSESFILTGIIPTRTYPIHIMLNEQDGTPKLEIIGSYRPLEYFSYGGGSEAGGNFDFDELTVIEKVLN